MEAGSFSFFFLSSFSFFSSFCFLFLLFFCYAMQVETSRPVSGPSRVAIGDIFAFGDVFDIVLACF